MVGRRTAAKLIRFHPDELRRITDCARQARLTPARYIRETALGAIPKARSHAATGPLLRALAHIGRRLDQIACQAETGPDAALPQETRAALKRHEALVRHVVQGRRHEKGASPP